MRANTKKKKKKKNPIQNPHHFCYLNKENNESPNSIPIKLNKKFRNSHIINTRIITMDA